MPDEVEARSLLAFCVAIGRHFLAADHGDRMRDQVLTRAVDLLLDRPSATTATGPAKKGKKGKKKSSKGKKKK